ncbi:uroporphyrinogen decarboxylase family protein [Thermodesulfobacteriota bacterium]
MPKGTIKKLASLQEMSRPPFIPLLYTYSAKLAQIPVRRLLTDAASLTKALSMAYKLLQYDAVVIPFDPTLEAEALGCRIDLKPDTPPSVRTHTFPDSPPQDDSFESLLQKGRFPVVTETIKRFQSQLGREVDILAGVTGPLTLAFQLRGENFQEDCESNYERALETLEYTNRVSTVLSRFYGEMGLDGILLIESSFSRGGAALLAEMKSICRSISNTCDFFELPVIIYIDGIPEGGEQALFDLEWSGLILQNPKLLKHYRKRASKLGRCVGLQLPLAELHSSSKARTASSVKHYMKEGGSKGFFLSTDGEISFATPVETLHEIMKTLKNS